jgi:hypothetical protein
MTDAQMRKAVERQDLELWETYRGEVLKALEDRNAYPDPQSWKNRCKFSFKLDPPETAALYAYAKANDCSLNRAIKQLITTHPVLTNG